MKAFGIIERGVKVGLQTTWSLGKIIFPVTLVVGILQYTVIIEWLMNLVKRRFHVLGNVLNLYAAIGAMQTLDMTVKQVFIIAIMLSFSHALLVKSSIAAKVGVNICVIAAVRIFLASISGWIIHILWQGGSEQASYGIMQFSNEEISGWLSIALHAIQQVSTGILQLAIIVIPLMIGIQWLDVFLHWISPFTRMLA